MPFYKTTCPIAFSSFCRLLLISLFIALLPKVDNAQSTFGSIRGTVRDPGSLPVPLAAVTLRDVDENTIRSAAASDSGEYSFENLKPGHYTVSAIATGFSESPTVALELTTRQSARADLALSLSQVTQSVQVEAAAEQINTENAVIGETRDTSQLVQMPVNSRASTTSPLASLTLSPEVVTDSQGNIAVGGATFAQTGFSVDGISSANVTTNGSLENAYPSSEGLGELTVTSFNNSAEFSQVADVTFTTKSGTNQLHGSAFEYLQNDALDATVLNFSLKAPKRFNTFGGSFGGPVTIPHLYDGKDKTFFFVDYEGNRRTASTPEQYIVPTQAERDGSAYGLSTTALNRVSQNLLNEYYPLPNINGVGYNYETLTPTPSRTNGWDLRLDHNITSSQQIYARYSWKKLFTEVANNLLPDDQDTEHDRSLVVSYNYSITPKMINEFRFGFTNSFVNTVFPIAGAVADNQLGLTGISFANHPTTGAFPTFNFSAGTNFTPIGRDKDGPGASKTLQFTDNFTRIIGKHSLRFGLDARRVFYETVVRWGQSDDFGAFTFDGLFTGNAFEDFLQGLPSTSFIVQSSPNTNESAIHWGIYGEDTWQASNRLTVSFGLRWEVNPKMSEASGDIANFLPTSNGEVVVPDNLAATVASNPLLAANYNAFLVSFNACQLTTRNTALPCSNVETASQAGLPSSLSYTYWHDFDPRVSVAFRPFKDNRTVLRGGFGIFTNTMLGPFAYDNIGIPLGAPYTYTNGGTTSSPLFQFPATSPTNQALTYGGTGFYDGEAPHYKDPQTMQWNATVEREFGADTAVRVSYVGMYSYRLNITEDYNAVPQSKTPYVPSPFVDPRAPYQNWIELYYSQNGASSNYNALVVEGSHKASHGLYFQGSYTFAKSLSDAQGDAPGGFIAENLLFTPVADQFDIGLDRGNVAGMPRHRFLLTARYELPFGAGKNWKSGNRFVDGALGGWSVNTITTAQTGQWLTPTINASEDQSNTGIVARGGITLRPDRIGNPNVPTDGSLWNLGALVPTPAGAGRIGDAGVGILEGPGLINVNLGLSKTFPIRERARLRFEVTFTNVLNHTNFAPPATDVTDQNPITVDPTQTFGILKSALPQGQGGNRTGQVALRLDF